LLRGSGKAGAHLVRTPARRHQRRRGPSAGAEVADPQVAGGRGVSEPVRGPEQPRGEQINVEAEPACALVDRLFVWREQVDQQCGQPLSNEGPGDGAIARAEAAAPAAVGEQHDPLRPLRESEIPLQHNSACWDADRLAVVVLVRCFVHHQASFHNDETLQCAWLR
jgi:hypothetical protein